MIDDLKFELEDESRKGARIKVVGVGGAGSNAVGRMYEEGLPGVEFYVMNTDAQALGASRVPNKLQIGARITGGLGAGSNPEVGRQSALEDTDTILDILEGADMVFVTAGMGGGTGGGAAPVVARLARQLDALTIAIVTKPFGFEGGRRMAQAFRMADDVLRQAVEGISELILLPGLINLDFSDIRAAISNMGHALIGMATASGPDAAMEAARGAISSPLLEDTRIAGARQILMNICGSTEIGLYEVSEACSIVREASGAADLQLNFGVITRPDMGDAVKVTVIATGFPAPQELTVPAIEALPPGEFFSPRQPGEMAAHPEAEFVPEAPLPPPPEPAADVVMTAAEEVYEDELDVPAYLRQGKLVG